MILTTGGRARGATSTRSRPRSCAAARASSIVKTPSWSPLSAITRTGLMRICRFTRVRGALLLLSSGGRCAVSLIKVKTDPGCPPQIRNASHLCSEVLGTLEHSQREAWGGALAPTYLIVDRNLVERHRLHKCDSLSVPSEPTRHDRRVVLEDQPPPLGLSSLIDAPPRLERDEGLQVIAHDPRQRQMRCRGHQVRDEARPLAAALDQDRLVIRDVSGRGESADARQDLRFSVDELERNAREVVGEVAARGALVRVAREVELPLLHDVASLGKGEADLPRRVEPVIAAGVIEMQMGVDYPVNVVGAVPKLPERILQLRSSIAPHILDTVDVGELRVLLVADSGVNQHQTVIVLDEQTAQGEGDAVAIIGWGSPCPQRLGDDAKHGSAV